MKINERLYPHPVQAHFSDDLIGCLFQVTPTIDSARHAFKLSVLARTSSQDLRALIESNKAQYAIHIECAATRYRRLITSFQPDFYEEIPADKLEGKVELCSLIVATEEIAEYKNANFHPDYGATTFLVRKGDVLAVGNDIHFDAIKEVDPLQNISSIFKVRANLGLESLVTDLQGDNIIVYLSQQNFNAYSELKMNQDLNTMLASMIILPSLIQALETIKAEFDGEDDAISERRWFKVINRKLKERGYKTDESDTWQIESTLVMAQNLIGDPLSLALKSMLELEYDSSSELA